MRFVERGLIEPVVGKVLPLREIAHAQNLMENKVIAGKIATFPLAAS
jgi:NADPH:quinone reductase-like Zn-dependent oxidoreductase